MSTTQEKSMLLAPLCAYLWAGRSEGVRGPEAGETPLSEQEVALGLALEVLP